jgi:hypothetical protein
MLRFEKINAGTGPQRLSGRIRERSLGILRPRTELERRPLRGDSAPCSFLWGAF